MNQWINEATKQWVKEAMKQWFNESMNQWFNEPSDQRVSEYMNPWIKEPMNECMNGWMDEWATSLLSYTSAEVPLLSASQLPLLQLLQPKSSLHASSTVRFATSAAIPHSANVAVCWKTTLYNAFSNLQLSFCIAGRCHFCFAARSAACQICHKRMQKPA